jgi:hypothetical protein
MEFVFSASLEEVDLKRKLVQENTLVVSLPQNLFEGQGLERGIVKNATHYLVDHSILPIGTARAAIVRVRIFLANIFPLRIKVRQTATGMSRPSGPKS